MNNRLQHDVSAPVDLTRRQMVGPVRSSHPVYVDLLPPCNDACPAGENIQAWLAHAQAGRSEGVSADPRQPAPRHSRTRLPSPVQTSATHTDSSVSIHAVERFLGDLAIVERWPIPVERPPSGKRVLVIGAGPSGLSAAYHLARLGHVVEIHDAGPVAGGMLEFGIPAYRLPRDIVARETGRLEEMGVRFVFDHKVENVLAEQRAGAFDAVYVAVGAQANRHVDIPVRDSARVLAALPLLREVGGGERPRIGRRVVIYGGGNTAMDAARTAKRLGAEEAVIVYRRDQAHMTAHAFEADKPPPKA
jgi:NADPH-dependent glutamate synthase beta subunit-like oxidoreductase